MSSIHFLFLLWRSFLFLSTRVSISQSSPRWLERSRKWHTDVHPAQEASNSHYLPPEIGRELRTGSACSRYMRPVSLDSIQTCRSPYGWRQAAWFVSCSKRFVSVETEWTSNLTQSRKSIDPIFHCVIYLHYYFPPSCYPLLLIYDGATTKKRSNHAWEKFNIPARIKPSCRLNCSRQSWWVPTG